MIGARVLGPGWSPLAFRRPVFAQTVRRRGYSLPPFCDLSRAHSVRRVASYTRRIRSSRSSGLMRCHDGRLICRSTSSCAFAALSRTGRSHSSRHLLAVEVAVRRRHPVPSRAQQPALRERSHLASAPSWMRRHRAIARASPPADPRELRGRPVVERQGCIARRGAAVGLHRRNERRLVP